MATIPSKILLLAVFIIATLSACNEKPLQADVYSAPIRANILKADKAVGFYQSSHFSMKSLEKNLNSSRLYFRLMPFTMDSHVSVMLN